MNTEICLQILKFIIDKNPSPFTKGISFDEINQNINTDVDTLQAHLNYLCDGLYLRTMDTKFYQLTTLAVSCNLDGLKLLLETPSDKKTIEWLLEVGNKYKNTP